MGRGYYKDGVSLIYINLYEYTWPSQFWGELVRYFVEGLSIKVCVAFFSWLDRVMGFGKEDHRGEVAFLSQQVKGTCYQHDLPLMLLHMATWLRQNLSVFSTIKLFSPPPILSFSILYPLAGSHQAQPTLEDRSYAPLPWGFISIIWNSVQEICLSLSHLFIQSFI